MMDTENDRCRCGSLKLLSCTEWFGIRWFGILVFTLQVFVVHAEPFNSSDLIKKIRSGESYSGQDISTALTADDEFLSLVELKLSSQGSVALFAGKKSVRFLGYTLICVPSPSMVQYSIDLLVLSQQIKPSSGIANMDIIAPYEDVHGIKLKSSIEAVRQSCSETGAFLDHFISSISKAKQHYVEAVKSDSPEGQALRQQAESVKVAKQQDTCQRWATLTGPNLLQARIHAPECQKILDAAIESDRLKQQQRENALQARVDSRRDTVPGFDLLKFGMRPEDVSAVYATAKPNCLIQYDPLAKVGQVSHCYDNVAAQLYYDHSTFELNGIELFSGAEFYPPEIRKTIGTLKEKYGLSYESADKNDIQMSNGQIQRIALAAFADWHVVYYAELGRDGRAYTSIAFYDNAASKLIKSRWGGDISSTASSSAVSKPVTTPKAPQNSLKDQYRVIEETLSAAGDPEGESRAIDLLSNPKTVDDWRFLAALDKERAAMDCGDAAFCYARQSLISKAEQRLKERGLGVPPGVDMQFLILKSYKD